MIGLYIALGVLAATNIVTLFILYKLVTQLSSKVMAANLPEYKLVESARPKTHSTAEERQGHRIRHEQMVPIDLVDPNELAQSLAAESGRANEYEEFEA